MNDYQQAAVMKAANAALTPVSMTLRERIKSNFDDATRRAAELEHLLELLDRNPEFEQMLTLMSRQGGLY